MPPMQLSGRILCVIFCFSNVAYLDTASHSANIFSIFSQESHVAVNGRIREFFVVLYSFFRELPLVVRINGGDTRHNPFPTCFYFS